MILIAALTREHVIGRGDGLPWHVPADAEHFRRTVSGAAVLIGRRSYGIFRASLSASRVFVLTRRGLALPDVEVVGDLEDGIRRARATDRTVWCAGGAAVYRAALPLADGMLLSWIDGEHEGDTFFPRFDPREWTVVARERRPGFELVRYRRAAAAGVP